MRPGIIPLLYFFSCFLHQPLQAQVLQILDAETKTPVERATIQSLEGIGFAVSNDLGKIDWQAFTQQSSAPGDSFVVRCMGYQAQVLSYRQIQQLDFQVQLKPSALSLDQVVVSANKWHQSSRELPVHIATLKRAAMLFQNPQTTADLLGQSGQVFVQKSQQGGGSPMIRGFATNRLLIAVDGVRMNNAIFRSGNLQNVISIDPLNLERTEIFFGPGSVIYGSDAIGGVMSFQTLDAQLSATDSVLITGSFNSRYASANQELSNHFDLNWGNRRWASRTSISYSDFGDLRMGRDPRAEYRRAFFVRRENGQDLIVNNPNPRLQVGSAYSQFNLMQKLRLKLNRHWDFLYTFIYASSSDIPRYDRLIRTRNGAPRNAEWYYGPQIWQMNQFTAHYARQSFLINKATLRLAQQRFEESRFDRDFRSDLRRERREQVDAYSLNLDLIKRLAEEHKLFYGLEAIFNKVSSQGQLVNIQNDQVQKGPDRYPQSQWQSYAAYLNHEWEISKRLTSQLGFRYSHYALQADFSDNLAFYPLPFAQAELSKGNLTGQAGLVYRPREDWKLRASIGSGFRAPNVDDIGKIFDSGDGIVVVPNPDLEGEYALNYEIGLAKIFAKSFKVDLSAYYTHLDNALIRRPFELNGQDSLLYDGELSQVQAIQNAAQAKVYGFQLGLSWQINEQWRINSHTNYQDGTETTASGQQGASRHAAPWFGRSSISYQHRALKAEFYAQYSGGFTYQQLNVEERDKPFIYAQDAQGRPFSPGWHTLNLKLSYEVSNYLVLTGGVENLSNESYRPYSSGLVAAGRNFFLNARFVF